MAVETIPSAAASAAPGPAAADGAVIRVEELHKYSEMGETRVHALRGVSLAVEAGGFVAIMGASGSGKSTFMNILGCLDRPSSGRYCLDGTDVSALEKKELAHIRNRTLGFVFQGFNLLPRTTALENVLLPTLYARMEKSERRRRAVEALALVGLADRAQHFPSQMSGGQQQRVAIARALVNRPAILLADEPTGNLDSVNSGMVLELFGELNRRLGQTVVMITHNPEAAAVAHRIIEMRDGRVVSAHPEAAPLPALAHAGS